jgi:hypothetical protein
LVFRDIENQVINIPKGLTEDQVEKMIMKEIMKKVIVLNINDTASSVPDYELSEDSDESESDS